MNKNDSMRILVDKYGLSYSLAEEVIRQDNVSKILNYLHIAYTKGKQDGTPTYNYNDGY